MIFLSLLFNYAFQYLKFNGFTDVNVNSKEELKKSIYSRMISNNVNRCIQGV